MSTARITRSFFCNRNCSGNFVNLNCEIKLESPYSFRSNDNLYIRNNSFKPQYIHVQILLYIFLKNELIEFVKRSKHFLLGDHFINSHNLISWNCMDIVRGNWCWSQLGLKGLNTNMFLFPFYGCMLLTRFRRLIPFLHFCTENWSIFFFQRKIATAHFKKRGNDSSPYSLKRKWRFTSVGSSSLKAKAGFFKCARANHAWNYAQ